MSVTVDGAAVRTLIEHVLPSFKFENGLLYGLKVGVLKRSIITTIMRESNNGAVRNTVDLLRSTGKGYDKPA
jgi:hypothetical protein